MVASKQPPTLLPPTQAQKPGLVELDTGQQEVTPQSRQARLLFPWFSLFVIVVALLLLLLYVCFCL